MFWKALHWQIHKLTTYPIIKACTDLFFIFLNCSSSCGKQSFSQKNHCKIYAVR